MAAARVLVNGSIGKIGAAHFVLPFQLAWVNSAQKILSHLGKL
jgi:hypothetical protein